MHPFWPLRHEKIKVDRFKPVDEEPLEKHAGHRTASTVTVCPSASWSSLMGMPTPREVMVCGEEERAVEGDQGRRFLGPAGPNHPPQARGDHWGGSMVIKKNAKNGETLWGGEYPLRPTSPPSLQTLRKTSASRTKSINGNGFIKKIYSVFIDFKSTCVNGGSSNQAIIF